MNDLVGEVKWFSNERGYGFVFSEDNQDKEYFVHFSSILIDGFKTLTQGQKVRFNLKETERGVQAVDVAPV
jgi:CspA family cold shock protein